MILALQKLASYFSYRKEEQQYQWLQGKIIN